MGMWQWYRGNLEMRSSSWDPHLESESHYSVWRDTQRGVWYGMKVRVSRQMASAFGTVMGPV